MGDAVRWEDERYVRLYTRDTPEFLALSWLARGLFGLIMRKVDRAGILPVGKLGLRGVAVAVGGQWTSVHGPLQELLDDGCVVFDAGRTAILIPNFMTAQEAPQSDVARKRASRERARAEIGRATDTVMDAPDVTVCDQPQSRGVTVGHAESHDVTSGHSDPIRSVPSQASTHTAGAPEDQTKPDADPHPPVGETWHDMARRLAPWNPFAADVLEQLDSGQKLSPSPKQRRALVTIDAQVAGAPPPKAAPSEGATWTSERWAGARAAAKPPLAAGDPSPRQCAELWDLATKAADGAEQTAAKKTAWSPSAREIVAFWIREYLNGEPPRAGKEVLKHMPLGMLVAKCRDGWEIPVSKRQVRGDDPTAPPSAPANDAGPAHNPAAVASYTPAPTVRESAYADRIAITVPLHGVLAGIGAAIAAAGDDTAPRPRRPGTPAPSPGDMH
jgi:hypothetical protein